jgi:hypothetical protein
MRSLTRALAVLLIAGPTTAIAQGAGELRGTVSDSSGTPVQFADIVLEPGGERVRSDSSGAFRFRAVAARTHLIRVRRIGFRPYEDSVTVERDRSVTVAVRLSARAQVLAAVRVIDQDICDLTSLEGFECRRAAGIGEYRDEAEILALDARHWADLVDGIPTLRRADRQSRWGLDWTTAPMPSRCLRRLFNGQPESEQPGAGRGDPAPDDIWQPQDVIAIEYYDNIRRVPAAYQRFAWPREEREGCALIIYWLRGASSEPPENWRRDWRRFARALAPYGVQGRLESSADATAFNSIFSREVQWRGVLESVTQISDGLRVAVRMPRLTVPVTDGTAIPMERVEFTCPRDNSRCAGFAPALVGKEILFRTTLVNRSRDDGPLVRIVGSGSERRVLIEAHSGSLMRVVQ